MSKPRDNRAHGQRRIDRLVQECVELGHNPLNWSRHLLAGLLPLVGGRVATLLRLVPDAAGEPVAVFGLDLGWTTARDRTQHYEQLVAANGFRRMASFQKLMAARGAVATRRRRQLFPDRAWYGSAEFRNTRRPLGLDDLLLARLPVGPAGGVYYVSFSRRLNESPFAAGESRLLHRFVQLLSARLGRRQMRQSVGLFNGLPERLQGTLHCLLDGDSEKQAAQRLGLSRFTLHEYVGDLYQHFGVNSRPELLARCYRHSEANCHSDTCCQAEPVSPAAQLPPRLRQTLDRLLQGDSEKQVARRLQLSPHTVHEYITALYRRFCVNSRAKLLVACRGRAA